MNFDSVIVATRCSHEPTCTRSQYRTDNKRWFLLILTDESEGFSREGTLCSRITTLFSLPHPLTYVYSVQYRFRARSFFFFFREIIVFLFSFFFSLLLHQINGTNTNSNTFELCLNERNCNFAKEFH